MAWGPASAAWRSSICGNPWPLAIREPASLITLISRGLQDEKMRTAVEAKLKLFGSLPEELKALLGSHNALRGMVGLHELFQCRALNKRLIYSILEALLIRVRKFCHHRVLTLSNQPFTIRYRRCFPKTMWPMYWGKSTKQWLPGRAWPRAVHKFRLSIQYFNTYFSWHVFRRAVGPCRIGRKILVGRGSEKRRKKLQRKTNPGIHRRQVFSAKKRQRCHAKMCVEQIGIAAPIFF